MTTTPILLPGQMEAPAGDFPELRLPSAMVFSRRAQRLRHLARGHSLGDYLCFMAVLAECQQSELDRHPEIPVPDTRLLASCREYAMPPLGTAGWHRNPHWQTITQILFDAIYNEVPAGGLEALALLHNPKKEWLEAQADIILAQKLEGLNLAAAPIIGAALQVQWTYLARQLEPSQMAWHEQPAVCPVCGGHPVASVIRTDGPANGLRYLHCSLCSSEWHMVRSKCSNCDSSKDISYYSIEGREEIVRAEACPACHSYLKVIHQEKDSWVDPVADDLATLALDLLMGEKKFAKSSVNFLMFHSRNK